MTTGDWAFASTVIRRTRDRLREQPDLQVMHNRTLEYLTVNRRGTAYPVLLTGVEVVSAAGRQVVWPEPPAEDDYVPRTRPWVAPDPRTCRDEMVDEATNRAVKLVLAALDHAEAVAGTATSDDQEDSLPEAFTIEPRFSVFEDPRFPGVPLVPLPETAQGVAWWLARTDWVRAGIGFSSIYGPVVLTAQPDPATGAATLNCTRTRVPRPTGRAGEPRFGTWAYDKETATATLSLSVSVPPALADRADDITAALAVDLVLTALAETGGPRPRPSSPDPVPDLGEAAALIPIMQDGLAIDLLCWDVRNEETGSTAELGNRAIFEFGVSRSHVLGGGIHLQARIPHPAIWAGPDEVASLSAEHAFAVGRWERTENGLEYSAFLSNRLLRLVADYPTSGQFLSTVILDVTHTALEVSES